MHSNKEVKKALSKYIAVKIDLDTQGDQVKDLKVKYIPLTIIYSPDGKEKHRKTGSASPADLVKLLEKHAK